MQIFIYLYCNYIFFVFLKKLYYIFLPVAASWQRNFIFKCESACDDIREWRKSKCLSRTTRIAVIPRDSISFPLWVASLPKCEITGRPIRATLGCVTFANRWNVCSSSLPRYESYRYPFIYGCPSDQARSAASGIILASGVICGHLALVRTVNRHRCSCRGIRDGISIVQPRESHLVIYVRVSLKS